METDSTNLSPKPTYWLTRFMILRLLGLVYFVAFLSLAQQLRPLIGERGLTPTPLFLSQFQAEAGSLGRAFQQLPSLFWFWHSDGFMVGAAWLGTVLSFLVL